jgi:hypothetical protein
MKLIDFYKKPFLDKLDILANRMGKLDYWVLCKLYISYYLLRFINKKHKLERPLVVSITSYPPRFATLHLTLMSLLSQDIKADEIVLWIYKKDLDLIPSSVTNLINKGLKIEVVEKDIKSYKKLIPALKHYPDYFIVTVDDDVYYSRGWLNKLVSEARFDQTSILCCRAHYIKTDINGDFFPYLNWDFETNLQIADSRIFLTGVGGVLYPPGCFHKEVFNENAFMDLCPTADDIWFYFMIRKNGYKCRKVSGIFSINSWRNTQSVSLASINVDKEFNDLQFKKMIDVYGNPLDSEL